MEFITSLAVYLQPKKFTENSRSLSYFLQNYDASIDFITTLVMKLILQDFSEMCELKSCLTLFVLFITTIESVSYQYSYCLENFNSKLIKLN